MYKRSMGYLRWALGVLSVWGTAWLLLGIRIVPILKNNPQPFVAAAKLKGAILAGVVSWALDALVAYLLVGLVVTLLGQIALSSFSKAMRLDPTFRSGVWSGMGGLFCFHGYLYFQVPSALRSLPILKSVPIGLDLLLFVLCGALCLHFSMRKSELSRRPLRIIVALLLMTMPMLLPHDVFRALMPGPSVVDPHAPRLLLFGVDGLRQDTLERIRPDWAAPGGCTPVTSVPATRKAWLVLYGSDPSLALNAVVMPQRSELSQPDRLRLLVEAERQGLRTAFLINDSLTPAFSLQPTPFSETLEPEGGWKYWFTLGYGSAWPAYSWAQNIFSIVETTNPWGESGPFLRDVERALGRNHWMGVHDCRLHAPILPTWEELQALDPWNWLLHPPRAFQSYVTAQEVNQDRSRLNWRTDGLRQYEIRTERLLRDLAPYLVRWSQKFPELSGLLFSDHGEVFLPIHESGKPFMTRLSGVHGFGTDAENLRVPIHPFGCTRHKLDSGQVYSLFDVRDDMMAWVRGRRPLELRGRSEGWLIQFPAIDGRDFTTSQFMSQNATRDDQGITISEITRGTYLLPSGAWFVDDIMIDQFGKRKKATALVTSSGIIAFNPSSDNGFRRDQFNGMNRVSTCEVSEESMNQEIGAFRGVRPLPVSENSNGSKTGSYVEKGSLK